MVEPFSDLDAELHCMFCGDYSHRDEWQPGEDVEHRRPTMQCPQCRQLSYRDAVLAWDRYRLAWQHGPLTPERIAAVVGWMEADGSANCHEGEDILHQTVLRAIARGEAAHPEELALAALGTLTVEFERWYA